MVKFLIHRPIAVIMSFIAVMLLGLVASGLLPVSLLPDIQIPEISVQVSYPNSSARELENTVVMPLRQQLLQVPALSSIESESRDGNGIIRMRFDFGTNMDYLYIEVNEKIDGILNLLPRDLERPKIIKASASDIPVFSVNLYLSETEASGIQSERFMELSEFAETVIKKRIEQLPQVAMVDVTGLVKPEVYIRPDEEKMRSLGITHAQLRSIIERNNISLGSLRVRDGKYQYNVRFSSTLHSVKDIEEIYFSAGNRLFQIRDIAETGIRPVRQTGEYIWQGQPAVQFAVIKQSASRMADLKDEMNVLLRQLETDYPRIRFDISQDQTLLLNYTIGNLRQNLILGGSLAILIMFFFLREVRAPFLIALSVPSSLIVSILFFKLTGLSLNIISLSGLILGVGMMIDNSIIVIDNITQYMDRGHSLSESCIKGTNEVIRPLISSVLTTCAVFIPLIFLSGLAGALFYDQAIAVSAGLFASLAVSITLLPTLYHVIYRKQWLGANRWLSGSGIINFEAFYNRGFNFVFKHKRFVMGIFSFLLLAAILMAYLLPKEKMPALKQVEAELIIDWNENIHIEENRRRMLTLLTDFDDMIQEKGVYLGEQQFLLQRDFGAGIAGARAYLRTSEFEGMNHLKGILEGAIANRFPMARQEFRPPANLFDQIFESQLPPLLARISNKNTRQVPGVDEIKQVAAQVMADYPSATLNPLPLQEVLVLNILPENLLLYGISQETLYQSLQIALNQYRVGYLRSEQKLIPVVFGSKEIVIQDIISKFLIRNQEGNEIPLAALVKMSRESGYKFISATKEGEYIPLEFTEAGRNPGVLMAGVNNIVNSHEGMDVMFDGSIFETRLLMREMIMVLAVALLLLYFILAAQFESLLQPLIVMIEIPINLAGVFLMLYLFDAGINIMSLIGIVVMAGIVINDSILKIDSINHLRMAGYSLMDALHTGGIRRLKPIMMTTLTTLLALAPVLFSGDMGSELQKPLALAIIGGMALGTIISLFFIPLAYYFVYRRDEV